MYVHMHVCLPNKLLNLNIISGMGGGGNECGSGLLGVTSNKYVIFPDRTTVVLWAHDVPSGECN